MSRISNRILAAVGGLVVLVVMSVQQAGAQDAPLRVVQGSDGTLYVVVGTTRFSITPYPISDDDLAAMTDGGALGSQLPQLSVSVPQPLAILVSPTATTAPALTATTPPAPTASPTSVPPTPVPPTATPRPTPVMLSGHGQTATNSVTLPAPISVLTFTHDGSSNFIVHAVSGTQSEGLVNVIGRYQGQRPLASSGPVVFDIKADGAWTVRIEPLSTGGRAPFSGTGDAVSALFDPPATGAWEVSHNGTSNFIVHLQCAGGEQGIENEIGKVQASTVVQFSDGPCFWEVQADGAWSLRPRS